jgi:hypothetical protein
MKPITITAELTLTPESFKQWCEGYFKPNEITWKIYVEKMLWSKFAKDVEYDNIINNTIHIDGVKITILENNNPAESELVAAAEEYVFEKNGHRFSNNNNEAGDIFASFIAGANWAINIVNKKYFLR